MMTKTTEMSNEELLKFLTENADVPKESVNSYAAGYFESALTSLMNRYPEVRKDFEWRVDRLRNQIGVE